MRVLRSERTCSATATLKGSIRNLGLFVSKKIDSNSAYSNLAQKHAEDVIEGMLDNQHEASEEAKEAVRCFTADEATQIIAAAGQPFRTMFAIAAMTGIRIGKILALQMDDFDFERRMIHVRRLSGIYGMASAKSIPTQGCRSTLPFLLARQMQFEAICGKVVTIEQCENYKECLIESRSRGLGTLCQTIRTKELPNSTNWLRTRTVPPPRTTAKKITRPDTSIPDKR